MEKLIEDVLEELRSTNLYSAAGRQTIVRAIMKEMRRKDNGFFLNMNSIDGERVPGQTDKEEEAKWVCEHCDESTFEVEYDYIGSNYNHLSCDLKKYPNTHMLGVQIQSDHNDGWTKQYYKDKLAEEIVTNQEEGHIFESPDGGKTVYKRKFGSNKRTLEKDFNNEPNS
jgi:hypothetical protein